MRKIFLFMMVSVDGYFEGEHHDLSWHNVDAEFDAFANEQLNAVEALLFGRTTYEMMAAFWPTPQGTAANPVTAERMNKKPKIVVSHEPLRVDWENTTVVSDNVFETIRKEKEKPGGDIAIFGSNNLCVSLMEAGLVDEFRIMVNPVALSGGSPLFAGLKKRTKLRLVKVREFASGNVLHIYVPAG